jgi:hypothetical protein
MDTLSMSLLALILIALAIVLAFNLLQGRQTRLRDAWRRTLAAQPRTQSTSPRAPPLTERAEPTVEAPAAGTTQPRQAEPVTARRREPTLGDPDGAARHSRSEDAPPASPTPMRRSEDPEPEGFASDEPASAGTEMRREPVFSTAPPAAASPDEAPPEARDDTAGPVLDPRLDCIVGLVPGSPLAAERVLAAIATLRRAGSKPVAVEVDAGHGGWAIPDAALPRVRRVRVGVLLANRHGPLNPMEYAEFSSVVQALARAIGAKAPDLPEMASVLDHARQLDEVCAQLDAQIGLNIETETVLAPAELAALATGLGLQERGNNRFTATGDLGETLFSLALGERAEQLTLLLDVPRAPQHADPWGRMLETAQVCVQRTGGEIIDDAGRVLTEADIAILGRQLEMRYRSLEEAGLDAGSAPALRIFN